MSIKKGLNKFWDIVWRDESPKGWLITLVFIFVVIKFVFLPLLSLSTGTVLPLAIVESCSMYHEGNFFSDYDEWWEHSSSKYSPFGIDKEEFKKFIFKDGFNKGDILFILGTKPEKLKIGDTIIFNAGQRNPVIHRIIKINEVDGEYIFSTIGDHNSGQLQEEISINENQIVGRAAFKLAPYIGWGKLIFFEYKQPQINKGFCDRNY